MARPKRYQPVAERHQRPEGAGLGFRRGVGTWTCYAVYLNGVCHESNSGSLKTARIEARELKRRTRGHVEIRRYDRSGRTNYDELVEVV